MVWNQLSINKPHLVYIILGGFTSIFMLCSSVIKERLYIGEATVATVCGILFGPHAANLIDPASWGNVDQITLEFSRIVLVVQCFAVGVELPKYYMEKHWRSVVLLLVPVMTFGWLITSLFIWGLFHTHLSWLDSLVCAACVTATDPVLASSVVGKGKFAKRVPKHLRDLLSAESGCNDGMAFPFIYLGLYLVRYRPDANEVAFHWFCNTVLYECIWGATYGVIIGYIARRAIRWSHENDMIDRESFLVFYFVLALFCAGSGSILGMDDLLIGFAAGVGFSNDGWFLEKTEEAHVSNVIDLLINLAFFVYFGTIIPWDSYNSAIIGITWWKLVVLAILVVFFRRIPAMLALKPLIPDVKTWREALFAGHFGPIGVGALFVAILARAELETDTTTPLAVLPPPGFEHDNIIELIWPITTFLVITSIIVHGSSIAVFTLGKHINTLTISLSYTQGNDQSNWMDRLPRIQSRSKSQMSQNSGFSTALEEKLPDYPAAVLPKNFLRRQKEEDNPSRNPSRPSSRAASLTSKRRKKWDSGLGPGGPIDPSAISPRVRRPPSPDFGNEKSDSYGTTAVPSPESTGSEEKPRRVSEEKPRRKSEEKSRRRKDEDRGDTEVYEEGRDAVIEDNEGNVLEVMRSQEGQSEDERRQDIGREVKRLMSNEETHEDAVEKEQASAPFTELDKHSSHVSEDAKDPEEERPTFKRNMWSRLGGSRSGAQVEKPPKASEPSKRARGPARAFKFGNTVIVEDEDGEVIKKYDIPTGADRKQNYVDDRTRQRLQRMGKWVGMPQSEADDDGSGGQNQQRRKAAAESEDDDDEQIRFTMEGNTRRMSKADFIKQIQELDPKRRASVVEESTAPDAVKEDALKQRPSNVLRRFSSSRAQNMLERITSGDGRMKKGTEPTVAEEDSHAVVDDGASNIPSHSFSEDLRKHSVGQPTAAEQRRRAASKQAKTVESDSEDDGTERIPPSARERGRQRGISPPSRPKPSSTSPRMKSDNQDDDDDEEQETAAERRRREAALGMRKEDDESDEDEGRPRMPPKGATAGPQSPSASGSSSEAEIPRHRGIRFVDDTTHKPKAFGSVRWGADKGR